MTTKFYVIVAGIVAVALLIAGLQLSGLIQKWVHKDDIKKVQDLLKKETEELTKQKELNDQTLREYETTQNAVRNLSQEIMRLRKDADKSRQDALVALQKQEAKETVISSLDAKIVQLEAELKQKKTVTSLEEAQRELVKYGIK